MFEILQVPDLRAMGITGGDLGAQREAKRRYAASAKGRAARGRAEVAHAERMTDPVYAKRYRRTKAKRERANRDRARIARLAGL